MSPEDTARLEQIRSKLYNYVANSSEETDDVKRARTMLSRIPKSAPRGPSLGSQPAAKPDEVTASDVQGDYGKRDIRRSLRDAPDQITTPEGRPPEARPVQFPQMLPDSPAAAWQGLKDSFTGTGRALLAANNALAHPVDTARTVAANPGAARREAFRGVNATIPGANTFVEAIGGPQSDSEEDAAATPGVSALAGVAAAPITGRMLAGIGGKATGAAVEGIKKADNAIGERAVRAANNPDRANGAGHVAKNAGRAVGAHIGYKAGGWPGAAAGGFFGGEGADVLGRVGNKLTDALARRHIRRSTTYAPPSFPDVTGPAPFVDAEVIGPKGLPEMPSPRATEGPFAPEAPPVRRQLAPLRQAVSDADIVSNEPANPIRLAPLRHEPIPLPRGVRPPPFLDEITGQPVTQAGQGGFLPGEASTNVGGRAVADIGTAKTELAPSPLREDVAAEAQRNLRSPQGPQVQAPEGSSLEGQLAKSVKILDDLKKAKAAGTLTPEMEQAAVDAGIPPENVARVVGRKTAASTDNPIAKARRDKVRQDAKNARILSGRND